MADTALPDGSDQTKPINGTRDRSVLPTLLMVAAVAAAAFAFGWPTRYGDFLSGDDHRFVLEHVFVNHPSPKHAWRLLTIIHGDLYQPLPMLTFQANYAMAGDDPVGRFPISPYVFHLTNTALHVLNASLACLVAIRLARRRGIGLLVGLMFACHPFAQEPVAWITGRMILLSATFSLLLLLICVHRREDGRGAWRWLAGLSWLLALASKVLPGVPVAAALCDHHTHRRFLRRCWVTYAVLLALGVGATWLAVESAGVPDLIDLTQAETDTSAPVRMLLAWRYYVENYVWPDRLSAWSPPAKDVSFLSSAIGVALIECVAFVAAAWLAWRYNRTGFLGLCLFVILLGPFLAATTARRLLTADRYMYLPIIGLHLAFAAAVVQIADSLRERISERVATGLVCLPCVAVLAIWLVLGWRQAPVWADTVARARRAAEVYPDDPAVRAELARAHIFAKDPDAALDVIAVARERWPDHPRLALQAGGAYRLKRDWRKAEVELRHAVERMPSHTRTQYDYALTLEELGNVEEARTICRRILREKSHFLPAAVALARSYRSTGDTDAAIAAFESAISINPYHRDSLFELAELMIRQRRWDRACELLQAIVEVDPGDMPARLNLGVALTHSGRYQEALRLYDGLAALAPAVAAVRINRAGVLDNLGRTREAEAEYRDMLATHPGHRNATVGLHELLQRQQRHDELVAIWVDLESASGAGDESRAYLAWAHVLDGHAEEAASLAAAIPDVAAERRFAVWALAFDALRRGDLGGFRRLLGSPVYPDGAPAKRHEQARIILMALSGLPDDVQHSPAGLYALARALAFDGNVQTARTVARQITAMPEASGWAEAALELVEALEGWRQGSDAAESNAGADALSAPGSLGGR